MQRWHSYPWLDWWKIYHSRRERQTLYLAWFWRRQAWTCFCATLASLISRHKDWLREFNLAPAYEHERLSSECRITHERQRDGLWNLTLASSHPAIQKKLHERHHLRNVLKSNRVITKSLQLPWLFERHRRFVWYSWTVMWCYSRHFSV